MGVLSMDVRIVLKYAFSEYDGKAWIGLIWLRIGTSCFERGNELSGFVKCK
jgi:hypothetical protein